MENITKIFLSINSFVWGPVMLAVLVGTGLFLSVGTRMVQYRKMGKVLASLKGKGEGCVAISPFQSLMLALSGIIGTGNIVGVATAIASGGPGAIFWMWVTAIFGGATQFGETVLSLKYRITNARGERSGGPMYYCSRGMEEKYGGNYKWLGILFALFGAVATFGTGNLVQANSIADSLKSLFHINVYVCGIVLAAVVGLVIIGGIKRLGNVAAFLVPFMAVFYVIASLTILLVNWDRLAGVFQLIFACAFDGRAVQGGLLGSVIRYGVARSMFTNEAGLGTTPIVHAASNAKDPVKQGLIASLNCFFCTIVVCTMTALVLLLSGFIGFDGAGGMLSVKDGLSGVLLTTEAFDKLIKGGRYIVVLAITLSAFSTILAWYYYGSKCFEYLIGSSRFTLFYQIFWAIMSFFGAVIPLNFVWNVCDTFNVLMAIPNLIAILGLSSVIFAVLRNYEKKQGRRCGQLRQKLA